MKLSRLTNLFIDRKKIETINGSKILSKVTKEFQKLELVSSFIERHSFITNFPGTIPTTSLINITTNSTEPMFLEYTEKSNKDLGL